MNEAAANLEESNPAPESVDQAPVDQAPVDQAPVDQAPVDNGDVSLNALDGGDVTPTPSDDAPFYSQFPDDWRQASLTAAGLDEEYMKYLDRVPDFPTLVKNYANAQEKIRAGEVSTGLPKDATDEQIQAYREANGIPSTPDDYDFDFNGDFEITETDEQILGGLTQIAHKHNIPNSAMGDLANAFFEQRQAEIDRRIQKDGLDQQTAITALKNVWGPDFEANRNITSTLVNQLPDTVRDMFKAARMPDGTSVFNSPEVVQFFADLGRKVNPSATITGTGDAMPLSTVNERIEKLRDITRSGKEHTPEQNAEYLKLLQVQESMQGR